MNQQRQQYLAIKSQHPDSILLMRSGDFYEAFDNDARRVAETCGLVLTSRKITEHLRIPLVGVPYHALDSHIAELVAAGHTVAVVEQAAKAPKGATIGRVVTRERLVQP